MTEYLRQIQAIANPFANRSYPSTLKHSPFAKRPKVKPMKRKHLFTRPHKDKLSKPRKINVGYQPEFIQLNWLAILKVKETEAVEQTPTFTQPIAASVVLTKPTPASAAPAQPMEALAAQCQKPPIYCTICTPTGKLCPIEYSIPFKADWSDPLEEEKDTHGQNKNEDNFSDIKDWDGD